jgi:hypothetical protein
MHYGQLSGKRTALNWGNNNWGEECVPWALFLRIDLAKRQVSFVNILISFWPFLPTSVMISLMSLLFNLLVTDPPLVYPVLDRFKRYDGVVS